MQTFGQGEKGEMQVSQKQTKQVPKTKDGAEKSVGVKDAEKNADEKRMFSFRTKTKQELKTAELFSPTNTSRSERNTPSVSKTRETYMSGSRAKKPFGFFQSSIRCSTFSP